MTPHFMAVMLADIGSLFLLPVGLLAFAFWVWMIVDCAKYETEGSTKIVWVLIIVLANVVGAPLYFFARKTPRRRLPHYQPPRQVYQPWQKDERIR